VLLAHLLASFRASGLEPLEHCQQLAPFASACLSFTHFTTKEDARPLSQYEIRRCYMKAAALILEPTSDAPQLFLPVRHQVSSHSGHHHQHQQQHYGGILVHIRNYGPRTSSKCDEQQQADRLLGRLHDVAPSIAPTFGAGLLYTLGGRSASSRLVLVAYVAPCRVLEALAKLTNVLSLYPLTQVAWKRVPHVPQAES